MQARSTKTDRHYDSWDDLVAAEADGYAVVVIVSRPDPKSGGPSTSFARTLGPFPDKHHARRVAATQRRRWKKALTNSGDLAGGTRLSVCVEPLWKDLRP